MAMRLVVCQLVRQTYLYSKYSNKEYFIAGLLSVVKESRAAGSWWRPAHHPARRFVSDSPARPPRSPDRAPDGGKQKWATAWQWPVLSVRLEHAAGLHRGAAGSQLQLPGHLPDARAGEVGARGALARAAGT